MISPGWARGANGNHDQTLDGNSSADEMRDETNAVSAIDCLADNTVEPTRILTYCFLQLANLDNGAFKRLNRYEAALWRQAVQTMVALRTIRCRCP